MKRLIRDNTLTLFHETKFALESALTHLKKSLVICCGTDRGTIEIRDPKSLNVLQQLPGHSGQILDMDISGNTLVSCGGSVRYILGSTKDFVFCLFTQPLRVI